MPPRNLRHDCARCITIPRRSVPYPRRSTAAGDRRHCEFSTRPRGGGSVNYMVRPYMRTDPVNTVRIFRTTPPSARWGKTPLTLPPPSRSCLPLLPDRWRVVICGEDGIPVFDRLRYGRQPQSEAVLVPPAECGVRGHLPSWSRKSSWACNSMNTSPSAATSFSATPASSASRVSCQSGLARPMSPAAHGIGSEQKIRQHRR